MGITYALAKRFVNSQKFVALLGDNIFKNSIAPYVLAFKDHATGAHVLIKEVDNPNQHG